LYKKSIIFAGGVNMKKILTCIIVLFLLSGSNVYGFYKPINPMRDKIQEEIKKAGGIDMQKAAERHEKAKKMMGKFVNPSKITYDKIADKKYGIKPSKDTKPNLKIKK
jgi:hypothetical protein